MGLLAEGRAEHHAPEAGLSVEIFVKEETFQIEEL